jgi:hypothetical protein
MKKLLLATTALLLLSGAANASFVFVGEVDTTGLGFGDVHRLLEVQLPTNGTGSTGLVGVEVGQVAPTPNTITPAIATGDAHSGADKASTPTISALGWTSGSKVGLGVDISQTGRLSDGLNLNSFGVNIYNSTGTTILATFTADPFLITALQGHNGPGNGTDVFNFALDAAQQQTWNNFAFNSGDVVGSFVNWGCSGAVSLTCQPANDGPDSLLAFVQPTAAIPESSTWAMMLIGFLSLGAFGMRGRGSRPFRFIST